MKAASLAPATSSEITALRSLIDADGLEGARRATALGQATIVRALAGLSISAGSRAAIREAVRSAVTDAAS